jgi:glycosyltransferase involved in cell wall biosynthesis
MNESKIAMLLNGPIYNDSRMIKIIRTISSKHNLDLFYMDGNKEVDKVLFNDKVALFPTNKKINFYNKAIRHTFFYNEFNFFVEEALKTNKHYSHIYACDLPTLKPACILKIKNNAKLIYDSHELYIEGLNQFFPNYYKVGFFKKTLFDISLNIMEHFGRDAERKMVTQVDFFITTSNSYKNYFEKNYNAKNIRIVMNCPPLLERKGNIDYRKEFNWEPDSFIVIYQGIMNPGRALDKLIDAISICPKKIKLVFMGYGTLEEALKKQTKELNLEDRVKFIGKKSFNELVLYSMGADMGVNLLENLNLNKKLASTNKLFEYLHAGIPILATDTPENKFVLEKYKVGYTTENTVTGIAEKILAMSMENLNVFKDNANKASNEFNWENQEQVILNIFSEPS